MTFIDTMTDTAKRILLIEDEDFIRDLYKRQLDAHGFATDVCANGKDGLAAIFRSPYDLVLLDIMLPDINGLQILKELQQKNVKNTPVVLLTNLGQESVIKEAFALGAREYISKASYTPDQLVKMVEGLLEKFQKEKTAT